MEKKQPMLGVSEALDPTTNYREYSMGLSSGATVSSFPSESTQTNPRVLIKGNPSDDTMVLNADKDAMSIGSYNSNGLSSNRSQALLGLRKRTTNAMSGTPKSNRNISDQVSMISSSTKGANIFRDSSYSGLRNYIEKDQDHSTMSESPRLDYSQRSKRGDNRTDELSILNLSANTTSSSHVTDNERLITETRDASRSVRADIERMLSVSAFKGSTETNGNATTEKNRANDSREEPPTEKTIPVQLFARYSQDNPHQEKQSISSNSVRHGQPQTSIEILSSSITGEEKSFTNSYKTPRKTPFKHNEGVDNDSDELSSNIIDRHEKVKAIVERVTKLKSSCSKHSYVDETDTIDNFSYGGKSVNGLQTNKDSLIKGIINFRKENNHSPISLATNNTHKTISTFRAEMMKFKQKWRIDDEVERESCERDDSTISSSSQKKEESLSSKENMSPSKLDSIENTSIQEEDFRLTLFEQKANEKNEGFKKDLFDIRKENLALKAQMNSIERKNEFLSQEHASEIQLKNNEITKLQTNIASLSENFCMEERGNNYYERTQILNMKKVIENLEDDLRMKDKEIYEMKSKELSSNTPRSHNGRDANSSLNEELVQAKQKNTDLIDEIEFLRKELDKTKLANGNRAEFDSKGIEITNSVAIEKMENLENERNQIHERMQKTSSRANELENVISKKNQEIKMLKSEISHSKGIGDMKKHSLLEMNRLRQEGREARHEKEVIALKNEVEESKDTIKSLHEKLTKTEESLAEAESRVLNMNGLKAMVKESESFISHLQNDKELLIERHDAAFKSINKELAEKERFAYQLESDLGKKIKALERQKDILTEEKDLLSKECHDQIDRLETSLSTEENNVTSLRSHSTELNAIIEEKSRYIVQLEHDMEDLRSEISSIKREKANTDLATKSLKADFEREKEKLTRKVDLKLRESEEGIDSLRRASQRKDKFVESLQEEIRRLSKNSNGDVSTPYQSRKENKSLIDFMEKELRDVREKKAEVEMKLKRARNDLLEMKKHVESSGKSFLDKMVRLEKASNEKDSIIVSLQNEINELNNCIEGKILLSKRELEQMEAELANARRIIAQDEEVQDTLFNHQEVQKSNIALRELVNVLREKLQNMEERLRELYKELSALRGDSDESKNEYVIEIQRLNAEVAEANKKKDSAEVKLKENSKLLSKAESIMAKTNEATLNAVMDALNRKK